jgi:hypothetical protein
VRCVSDGVLGGVVPRRVVFAGRHHYCCQQIADLPFTSKG